MVEKKEEFKIDMCTFEASHYKSEVEALKKEITTPTYTQEAIEGASVIGYVGSRIPVYGLKASAYPLVKIARISNKYLGREKVVDIKLKHYWAVPIVTTLVGIVGYAIASAPVVITETAEVAGGIGIGDGLFFGAMTAFVVMVALLLPL
jgi:hypothetical protein